MFSRQTIVEATQVLGKRTRAEVQTFVIRFGLDEIAPEDEDSGYPASTDTRANQLAKFFIRECKEHPPDGLLPDGGSVREAIEHIIESTIRKTTGGGSWSRYSYASYQHDYPELDKALIKDGYTVETGRLELISAVSLRSEPEPPPPIPEPASAPKRKFFAPSPRPPGPSVAPIAAIPSIPTSTDPVSPPPAISVSALPTNSPLELPPKLVQAQRERKLIPFVGAGLSLGSDVTGKFPTWRSLPVRLLEACNEHSVWHDANDRASTWGVFVEGMDPKKPVAMPLKVLLKQFDILKTKLKTDYAAAINAIFHPVDAKPGAAHKAVLSLGSQVIITTNYDRLLELAAKGAERTTHTGLRAQAALMDIQAGRKVLYKIHGTVEDSTSIVLTHEEYQKMHGDASYRRVLGALMTENSFLFVGYGMSDPNDLDILLALSKAELGGATATHYALLPSSGNQQTDVERADQLREDYRVKAIWYASHDQVVPTLQSLVSLPPRKRDPEPSTPATEKDAEHDTVRIAETPPSQNPFHPAGSLPAGHTTYITRECDKALVAALDTSPLITIEGAPSSGKSSLALKTVAALSKSQQVCYLDLQDSRTDNDNEFMRFFFDEIAEQLSRPVSNWNHIDGRTGQSSTIVIDEIGFLNTQIAKNFVPQLVRFATRHSERTRVIVCLPLRTASDSFSSFLKSIGISHAKYTNNWHRVSVTPFTTVQIGVLLDFLSHRARKTALEQIKTVADMSSGNPGAIQCLCSRLWDCDGRGAPVSDLYNIIRTPGAYE